MIGPEKLLRGNGGWCSFFSSACWSIPLQALCTSRERNRVGTGRTVGGGPSFQ